MKKGIIQIFLSNVIFMFFGVLNNFILPKFLSVNTYAMVKTYLLYVGYAGFLGLGFTEGMFLFFGGKSLSQTKEKGFGDKFITFSYIQIAVSIIIAVIGISIKSKVIVLFSFGLFQTNIVNYFKNYTTAVGEYKIYSIINSFEKIGVLFFNALLIFIVKTDDFIWYILSIIGVGIIEIIYAIMIINNKQNGIFKGKFSFYEIKINVSMGIILLISNGISTLFTGIDQWFVKILMQSYDFALYSFAVSLERIIALFITPITLVLYNYLCKNKDSRDMKFLREMLLIWGGMILLSIFPLKWVVLKWISHYAQALDIIAVLFAGQAINCIVNGIYTNLYKAERKQKKLLIQMIIMTILSIILNAIFYFIFKNLLCIAIATLITKFVWLIWCEIDNKEQSYGLYGNLSIIIIFAAFICLSTLNNQLIAFILYSLVLLLVMLMLMKTTFLRCLKECKNIIKKK